MATGRIGTTPVLRTRWSKEPAGGTTSLSGLDDNSVSLVYEVGYEAVYQNGALLSRGNDYTATDGTTITLTNATVAGDIIEVFANNVVPLTDTYSQSVADGKFVNNTIVDAKGDLIVGSAADTFTRLAVGTNNYVLTADSAEASGIKWAAATTPSFSAWTPTWTNVTVGNGTVTAQYATSGDLVFGYIRLEWGSTTSQSGDAIFSLPVTGMTNILSIFDRNGTVTLEKSGQASVIGLVRYVSTTTAAIRYLYQATSPDRLRDNDISSTSPYTWATGDVWKANFWYRKA